jgi:hypothetical protein
MNFRRFLAEQAELGFDEVLNRIRRECNIFLRETDKPLFRGLSMGDGGHAFFSPHPKNRPPRDSGKHDVFLFDGMIDAAFGIEEIRKHTVFATGDEGIAQDYGDVYFTFPVGKFKCLWSPSVKDSVQDLTYWHDMKPTLYKKGIQMNGSTYKDLWSKLSKRYPTAGEWVYDLDGDAEKVTRKVVADLEGGVVDNAPADSYKILIDIITFVGKHHYRLGDIDSAISSHNEILIYESNGYYSVPVDMVHSQMMLEKVPGAGRWNHPAQYKFLLEKLKSGT